MSLSTPEALAREQIDRQLIEAGWVLQDASAMSVWTAFGVAVREVSLKSGHGEVDYLLFVDGDVLGAIEAKKTGSTLTGVVVQSAKYSEGVPDSFEAPHRPLPFLYETTGVETRFTNRLDPEPRSRPVYSFHRPQTLQAWAYGRLLDAGSGNWIKSPQGIYDARFTLRQRLREMPAMHTAGLWPAQITAIQSLERSLAEDRPRALIQMATGSGKTFTAISAIYRLIRFGGAKRIVFLVDRANLGRQTMAEFEKYEVPDDGRKFTELYVVQHLRSNKIDPTARVVITTIQRLYSILRGEEELDEADEEGSLFDSDISPFKEPIPVAYNKDVPVEFFDVIFTDECHRSIYNLWRQVLEYFDAYLIGLTATPSKQTIGFFNQNLVMEYGHEQAVVDGVNVDFDIYKIETKITQQGSTVEASYTVDKRDRKTRKIRFEQLDEDLVYDAGKLDRDVVAVDQIRTVIKTFRQKVCTEIFPGRGVVPKTLIFAKDDSHADDIVKIVWEEFGKGHDFAQKITYKTTGAKPEDLINAFRNSFNPRIVVTVDMIATGTDIKPVEIVMFMRMVRSPAFFEQMKGRGVRVMNAEDFKIISHAEAKTRFVLVDCVGVTDTVMKEPPLQQGDPTIPLKSLFQSIGAGTTNAQILGTVASRLARLDKQFDDPTKARLAELAGGRTLKEIACEIVAALDPDRQIEIARKQFDLGDEQEPSPEQIEAVRKSLLKAAAMPLADFALRDAILSAGQALEQTIDTVSQDEVLSAGYSAAAREKARATVMSFRAFIEEHKNELTALQILFNQPYGSRMRFRDIKELAEAIKRPPLGLTTDALWQAYRTLDERRVRGGGQRVMTDILSVLRFELERDAELAPFRERVEANFAAWLAKQDAAGVRFTTEQRGWLEQIAAHIATSVEVTRDDFDEAPFNARGGLGKVYDLFGDRLDDILNELNEVLAA